MSDIYINSVNEANYPSRRHFYNPDNNYPEYLWGEEEISSERNYVYQMVRDSLYGLELDKEKFGTPEWNPFGTFINEGDTVLIKPNWVMHKNENLKVKENGMECLITHPSVVRAAIDFCLIALKGTGTIIVGDAPMQGCDIHSLIQETGYKELFDFYNKHNVKILPHDFRSYSVDLNKYKVLIRKIYNASEGIEVDINSFSQLKESKDNNITYRVSDYSEELTNSYHGIEYHKYLVNKKVLSADVVINLCKPKCHRLSGITGALKNFVGIIFDKACLPHRTAGSSEEGGDEYLYKSKLKNLMSRILHTKYRYEDQGKTRQALSMRMVYGSLYYISRLFSKDKFLIGSWYGNDTIWRTIHDLYFILLYADKEGIIQQEKQRKIFNLADMIISGEKNGPVSPEPKRVGVILSGFDAVFMDRIICEIMNFDYRKIPSVYNSLNNAKLITKPIDEIIIKSNNPSFNKSNYQELIFPLDWSFEAHEMWKGKIEK